jgi:hypothetical protein
VLKPTSRAQAGRPFALRITAGKRITSLSCSASASGRQLGTKVSLKDDGAAVCSMHVAPTSHGRTLNITMNALAGGKKLSVRYTTRVS